MPAKSIASITFSATVKVGSSWKNWNTTPTLAPRQVAIAPSSSARTSVPSTVAPPAVGRSMPAMRLSRVVLPLPDCPTMATNSPSETTRSTSSREWNVPLGIS